MPNMSNIKYANSKDIKGITTKKDNKTKKSFKIYVNKNLNTKFKEKLELLRNWINDSFYNGQIKEFCDSRGRFCQGATRILYRKLLNPVNQIVLQNIIGANVDTLLIKSGVGHFYLTILLYGNLVIIDPTFGQYVKVHEKIFVGTEKDVEFYFRNPSNLFLSADISNYKPTEGKLQPETNNNLMKKIKNQIKSGERNYNSNKV